MCAEGAGRRKCVLVAEDEPELRSVIVSALAGGLEGTDVIAAENGVQAWNLIKQRSVDLLLTDVVMPEMDGLTLLNKVRADAALSPIYVVLMTGLAKPEEIFAAMDNGADDCVLKPCRWEELVVRVRTGLRRVGVTRREVARAEELERLYARQTEYMSLVSHEIRTPMSAILSAANVLLRYGRQKPETVERFASVIHHEGRRLTRLINNVLDLAKIEAGHSEWSFSPTELHALVEQVRETFLALVGERHLALEVDSSPEPLSVTMDRDKITQVLGNLLLNSIKHSPDGATIWLRWRPSEHGGVRLEIEDEGAGIPPGREETIFERFLQLGTSEARSGSGLGLTISRQIVAMHGGRIWAAPGRSVGALFVVELPARPPEVGRDGPV
jgi:signal transduction histidine kinase